MPFEQIPGWLWGVGTNGPAFLRPILWDLCDANGQGVLPLWDDPVRSHCRQRAEAFPTRERFSPRKFVPSKRRTHRGCLMFSSTSPPLPPRDEGTRMSCLYTSNHSTHHLLLQNHPEHNLIRARDFGNTSLQMLSSWPGAPVVSIPCTSEKVVGTTVIRGFREMA